MAPIYEFHVVGVVGAVVRAALPEMVMIEQPPRRTLHGTAADRREIERVLELIQTLHVNVRWLQISTGKRGGPNSVGADVPVVDDGGPQHDVL